jgi:hypothetical protein
MKEPTPQKEAGAASTAPASKISGVVTPTANFYPFTGIAASDYAIRIIAARCHVSPGVARQIVELIDIGGAP